MKSALGFMVLAVLAVAGGCGGGSESASTEVETVTIVETAGTSTAGTTTGVTKSQAERLVKSMLLRLSDFPTGWRGEPPDDSDEGCSGIEKLSDRYDLLAKADSDDFAQGESTRAHSTSSLFPDEEAARDALNYVEGSIQSERYRDCLVDFFRGEDLTVGDLTVGQVSFPKLGDRSSAWEIVAPLESEGVSVTAFYDIVFIRTGTALSVIFFGDTFTPFDEAMREQLGRRVAERMDAAVAELP
jgi:hypothetical protein